MEISPGATPQNSELTSTPSKPAPKQEVQPDAGAANAAAAAGAQSASKDLSTLSGAELSKLPTSELNKLSVTQLNKLDTTALSKLSATQLSKVSAGKLKTLSPEILNKLEEGLKQRLGITASNEKVSISEEGRQKALQVEAADSASGALSGTEKTVS